MTTLETDGPRTIDLLGNDFRAIHAAALAIGCVEAGIEVLFEGITRGATVHLAEHQVLDQAITDKADAAMVYAMIGWRHCSTEEADRKAPPRWRLIQSLAGAYLKRGRLTHEDIVAIVKPIEKPVLAIVASEEGGQP